MLAAAKQRLEFGALDLVEFDPIAYIHACLLERGTHEQLNRMAGVSPSKTFTPKQGQYLAFIHLYTRLHRRPPAETDMQEYFRVSPLRFTKGCALARARRFQRAAQDTSHYRGPR